MKRQRPNPIQTMRANLPKVRGFRHQLEAIEAIRVFAHGLVRRAARGEITFGRISAAPH